MIGLSQESESIALRLADAQKVTVEEAVAARRARLAQHVQAIAALPILDPRSPGDMIDDLNSV